MGGINAKGPKEKAYHALYLQLRRRITGGAYPFGSRLPSKRLLSEETGFSLITVEHAYALLCEEGYAESRQRSGYYAIFRREDFPGGAEEVAEPVRRNGAVLREALPGSAEDGGPLPVHGRSAGAEQPEGVPPESIGFPTLARTMRRVLSSRGEAILRRCPNKGLPELREALGDYLRRTVGIDAEPEQIVIGAGAEYLYSLIARMFPGRVFGLEDPGYAAIRRTYETCGVKTALIPLGLHGLRTEALKASRAEILHVTPFHSFPTGITASASKRAEYLRHAERMQGYIIEDNYDSELTVSAKMESTLFAVSHKNRVLYLNTLTSTVSPSLRMGYMVLPKALLPLFEERAGFCACTVPVFEQYVLTELLTSGEFQRHIARVRRARRRQLNER